MLIKRYLYSCLSVYISVSVLSFIQPNIHIFLSLFHCYHISVQCSVQSEYIWWWNREEEEKKRRRKNIRMIRESWVTEFSLCIKGLVACILEIKWWLCSCKDERSNLFPLSSGRNTFISSVTHFHVIFISFINSFTKCANFTLHLHQRTTNTHTHMSKM